MDRRIVYAIFADVKRLLKKYFPQSAAGMRFAPIAFFATWFLWGIRHVRVLGPHWRMIK